MFADIAAEHGYELNDPATKEEFLTRVRVAIDKSTKSDIEIYGKRTESLFAYVAGALGNLVLLKQEDSGDFYFSGGEITAPDYRLTLEGGDQFLVEVKNCHFKVPTKKYYIKRNYYEKLKLYSDLNGLELRFAIYFSAWNIWTLVIIDNFEENEKSYTIDLVRAMACSEMAMLGDCMIGTSPDLELHLLADPSEGRRD